MTSMSKVVKIPSGRSSSEDDGTAAGKRQPPSQEGFLSFLSLWEDAEREPDAAPAVDPMQQLREKEEEIRRQGEEIVRLARENAVRIEEEAYEKGYASGEEAGRKEGLAQFEAAVQRFDALLQEVQSHLARHHHRYEEEVLLLIKTMVDRLTHHEVSVNPRVIQACLQRAMAFVVEKSVVRVHLHPDDFSRVKEASLQNPSLLEGKSRIDLMEDGSIAEGGCFLETDFGDVDASLEHSREKLYEAVDQAFRASLAADDPVA
ncbi:MAG: FliH/SctL family protein [Desulfobulbaceae bacterium]|nr:FliH/SctL family protein [Desulfobulbaceae bacterium]